MNEVSYLRFGLLCNSLKLERWQADAIRQLIEGGMQLVVVVTNDMPEPKERLFKKLTVYPYCQVLFRVWNRYIFRPKSKSLVDIRQLIHTAEIFQIRPTKKGISNYFKDEEVHKLKTLNLDFILRFGFNIIRGDILEVAKYGVWSFHHDDEEVIRGGPPGFWEVYKGSHINAVILQQLTDSLDKGIILKKDYYRSIKHSYKAHLDQIYEESSRMPIQVCRNILEGRTHFTPSASKAKIYRPPDNIQFIWFACKMIYRRISFHIRHLFWQEDWNVGLINRELETIIDLPELSNQETIWLPKTRASEYPADPFVTSYRGEVMLFYELFSYAKGKGIIAMSKASENFQKVHKVLSGDFHYSFPFVFKHHDELYCIPECYESNSIRLFHWHAQVAFGRSEKELISDVSAVDPVLFELNGLWWLLFTKKHLPSVHLYAYYAKSMFGPFTAHFNNPIKSDISSSRNAGSIIISGGKVIRPAQDCARDYGVAVVLNEIISLDPTHFEEAPLRRIEPFSRGTYNRGLHTLNGIGDLTVIDGKSFGFTLAGFMHQLKHKFNMTKS